MDQIQIPEIRAFIKSQLIFNKGAKREKIKLLNNQW